MKTIINTEKSPPAIGPYSQATQFGDLIFTSGQLPVDMTTGVFQEGIAKQTEDSLMNVKNILESANSSMEKVIKITVFLSDMNNFAEMNEVYSKFFKEGNYPARSTVEVARLPKDALVEIEVIAYK